LAVGSTRLPLFAPNYDILGNPTFLYINVPVLPGRGSEAKQAILRRLSGVVEQQLRPCWKKGSIGLQLELSEFDGELTMRNFVGSPNRSPAIELSE
jgi:5-carboxymethyl-2-hydroxymuconate isomerase